MAIDGNIDFTPMVNAQIDLLRDGKPLAAFDKFFATDGVMYANDILFARSAEEGRRRQVPFFTSATSIRGQIVDLTLVPQLSLCVFRNQTSFTTGDGEIFKINGLCWQRWRTGRIVEERYYDGVMMQTRIKEGLLTTPELLLPDPDPLLV